MNWLFDVSLMFIFSVFQYLTIRKSTILKVPTIINNLAMFIVPLFIFIPMSLSTPEVYKITPYQFFILFITAFFMSYLGNLASLKSISLSQNPGYPLMLSKSYVLFTTVASVLFLNQSITFLPVFGILLIVGGSVAITINKNKKTENNNLKWLPYALASFFAWGSLALTSKYLLNIGVSVLARLIYLMSMVTIFILIEKFYKKTKINFSKNTFILFILNGLGSAGFNYFMQKAYLTAPNVGYVNAINASSIAAVTILSSIIFKDELNLKKLIGILIVTTGVILLVIH